MSPPSIQSILKKYCLRPKKRLGQHFLASVPTMEKIIDAVEIEKDDLVLEIGAGTGLMTAMTAGRCANVIAIERDRDLIDIASSEFGHIKNIRWIGADVLKLDVMKIAQKPRGCKIIGNLPYNISSPILFWMLDGRDAISRAVIMLQKEVGMRIVAKPGGKDYGILSVSFQAFADCKRMFNVSAKSFVPPPEVESSVVRIDFKGKDPGIDDESRFRTIVKAAFGKRRKTIRNSLLGARGLGLGAEALDSGLAAARIDPRRRPEALSVDEYIELAHHIGAVR